MMITLLVSVAGPGFCYMQGETVDVPTELATEFIRAGYAVEAAVRDARKPAGKPATAKASKARRESSDDVRDGK